MPATTVPCITRNRLPSYLGDAEVPELNDPRAREEDVLRLEVAVEDLAVMDVFQGQRRLHEPVVQSNASYVSPGSKIKRVDLARGELRDGNLEAGLMLRQVGAKASPKERRADRDGVESRGVLLQRSAASPGFVDQNRRLASGSDSWHPWSVFLIKLSKTQVEFARINFQI